MAIGYVYLMTNGKDHKIGLTASEPEKRRKQLQTGNSEQVDLVAYTICKDMNNLEANLHRRFASNRKAGEWFELDRDDLCTLYELFKKESINLDMSLIPDPAQLNLGTDVEKFMEMDGKRLALGKSLLYKEKYKHISNYKEIVFKHMKEEEIFIEDNENEEKNKLQKEWDVHEHLEKLMEEDAGRIVLGKKPLHTFEYQSLDGWKDDLEQRIIYITEEIDEIKNKKAIVLRKETNGNIIEIVDAPREDNLDFFYRYLECSDFDKVGGVGIDRFNMLVNMDLNRTDSFDLKGNLIFVREASDIGELPIWFDATEDIDKIIMIRIILELEAGKFQKTSEKIIEIREAKNGISILTELENRKNKL